jgi:hypothetical protein
MKIIKTTINKTAYDLKGNRIIVKTYYEQAKNGRIYTRREAVRIKRVA